MTHMHSNLCLFSRAVRRLGEFEQIGSSEGRLEPEPMESVRSRYLRPFGTLIFPTSSGIFFFPKTQDTLSRTEAKFFYLYTWVVHRYKRMESVWVHGVTNLQLSIEQSWTSEPQTDPTILSDLIFRIKGRSSSMKTSRVKVSGDKDVLRTTSTWPVTENKRSTGHEVVRTAK